MKTITALQHKRSFAYPGFGALCIVLLSLASPVALLAQEKPGPKQERKPEREAEIIVLRKNKDGTVDTLNKFAQGSEKETMEFKHEEGNNGLSFRFDGEGDPDVKIWGDNAWEEKARGMADSLRKRMKNRHSWAFGWEGSDDAKRNREFRFYFRGPKGERRITLPPPMPGRPLIPDWPDTPPGAPGSAPDVFFFHKDGNRLHGFLPPPPHTGSWGWKDHSFKTKNTLEFEQFSLAPDGNENIYRIKLRTDNPKDPIRIRVYNSENEVVFTDTGKGASYEGAISLVAFGRGSYLLEVLQCEKAFSRQIFAR